MFSSEDLNICPDCSYNQEGFCEKRQMIILGITKCEYFTEKAIPKMTKEEKQEFRATKAWICKQLKEVNFLGK